MKHPPFSSSVARFGLLSSDEQLRLLRTGKHEDRVRVVESVLRYARYVSWPFSQKGTMELDECLSEATIGLMQSLDRFDPSENVKFITYSKWWMLKCLYKAVERQHLVRIPRHAVEKGLSPFQTDSLNAPARRGEPGTELIDTLESDAQPVHDLLELQDTHRLVRDTISGLPPRLRKVIVRRFWEGKTLREIGVEMGITREGVRQIEIEAKSIIGRRLRVAGFKRKGRA